MSGEMEDRIRREKALDLSRSVKSASEQLGSKPKMGMGESRILRRKKIGITED